MQSWRQQRASPAAIWCFEQVPLLLGPWCWQQGFFVIPCGQSIYSLTEVSPQFVGVTGQAAGNWGYRQLVFRLSGLRLKVYGLDFTPTALQMVVDRHTYIYTYTHYFCYILQFECLSSNPVLVSWRMLLCSAVDHFPHLSGPSAQGILLQTLMIAPKIWGPLA